MQCARQVIRTLDALLPKGLYKIKTLNADEVKRGAWRHDAALVVFSGGETKKWRTELGRRGQDMLRHGMRDDGIPFLMFCAGAYFGVKTTAYNSQTEDIFRSDGLGFADVVARGPLGGKYDYFSRKYALATPITWHGLKLTVPVYFNGGCGFESQPGQAWPAGTDILATYDDFNNRPAVIAVQNGAGRAVLWGLHGEFPWHTMQTDPDIAHLIPVLAAAEPQRLGLMHDSLTRLGLKTLEQFKVA